MEMRDERCQRGSHLSISYPEQCYLPPSPAHPPGPGAPLGKLFCESSEGKRLELIFSPQFTVENLTRQRDGSGWGGTITGDN